MKKILITLVLLSLSLCQEETLIQLEEGGTLTNLNHLMSVDYSSLGCQTNFLQFTHQLKMWSELMQDEKVIHHEIKLLSNAHKIFTQQRFNRLRNTNTLNRAKRVLAALRHNTHKKQHTLYQQWRVSEVTHLKNQIHLLQTSTNEDESKQCCDRIEQLINKFLEERKHIAKQCGNADVTINIINDAEGKIEVVNKKCHESDPDVKVNKVDSIDKVIVGQKQQTKQQEQVVTKQEEQVVVQEQHVVQEAKQEEQVVVQETKQEQVVVQEAKQEEHVETKQEEHVETKQEEHVETKQEEHVETKQEQQVVSESKTETVETHEETTEETTEEVTEETEETEEVVTETVVSKTTSSKVVTQPDDEDDEEVEGEIVSTQGVGASGEGGRV